MLLEYRAEEMIWHRQMHYILYYVPGTSQVTSVVKNLPANAGDKSLIPGSERSPGGGNGYPTSVFLPGKAHGPGIWQARVNGVTKSWTRPSK